MHANDVFEGSSFLWIPAALFAFASLLAAIRASWFIELEKSHDPVL